MIKVPQLIWESRSPYNYAYASKADSDVIGMCVPWRLALVLAFGEDQNSPGCSHSTQYGHC